MSRGETYYLYKDTISSKLSPFKPELITELAIVNDNRPENPLVKFNNGHFLHNSHIYWSSKFLLYQK